jgi:hypothetical protein
MVALLHPPVAHPRHASHASHARHAADSRAARSGAKGSVPRSVVGLGALAAVLLLALLMLRTLQAVPAVTHERSGPPVAAVQGSEAVHVVEPGESLWGIASALAPGVDPRPIVDRLAERNGGSALQVGQKLVIPAELLG